MAISFIRSLEEKFQTEEDMEYLKEVLEEIENHNL